MNHLNLSDVNIYYEEKGNGQAVIFLHGIWLSGDVFKSQLDYFGTKYRAVVYDMRGHGRSEKVHTGHTIAQYAADLQELIEKLDLKKVVLVGWSMGGLVVWDYLKQFGGKKIFGTVIVGAPPSEFRRDDWEYGSIDLESLCEAMRAIQTNRDEAARMMFIPSLFKEKPDAKIVDALAETINMQPASIGSAIFFDLAMRDYREFLPNFDVPTLICLGRRDAMTPEQVGFYLATKLPQATLAFFEQSGHSPFLEEPHEFNRIVESFIERLTVESTS